ncbi:GlxA family transcriptional regulator [Dyella tabacisoli]|uniref:GlxA family transcriptional regulator n=1 Tax=Dyella tabacisoli TaxID=2282381 RepID=A0A369UPH0_9GAMM|nr:GlxA family transcriptional regulator [Dyella tabacisoli]RDD82431.1 GlxA family transcriptional regulator [Dyella tabacisoli]
MAELFQFVMLPGFSMIGLMATLEPLRVANRFAGEVYRWRFLSADGAAVRASNGLSLPADCAIDAAPSEGCIIVVAGFEPLRHYTPALANWLRHADRHGATLGAIDTGCFCLAEAGLLRQVRVTLHWEAMSAFEERYPDVSVSGALFEIGRRRLTSAGGTTSIDMMLQVIGERHGAGLATAVSEQFVRERIRDHGDHQRMQVSARYEVHNKKLVQAIGIMEDNLEVPLGAETLAARVAVTCRQLQRLFREHMRITPGEFYMRMRLQRARQLLRHTDMNVLEVGMTCGFSSSSHFSRAYRVQFGVCPRSDRSGFTAPRAAGSHQSGVRRHPAPG